MTSDDPPDGRRVELRVLGALALSAPAQPDASLLAQQPKRLALLSYLAAATPRGFHRRDKLLALFWPELDEQRARGALSQALYTIRSALGDGVIVSRGASEVGVDAAQLWCDAVEFEALLDQRRPADALPLYRSDFLDGFFVSNAPEFEHWADSERARYRGRAADASWALADAAVRDGDVITGERLARRAVDLSPSDEAVVRRLMRFFDSVGDRAAALQAFEDFTRKLAQELELQPSAETHQLATEIARGAPSPTHGGSMATGASDFSMQTPVHAAPPPFVEPVRRRSNVRVGTVAAVAVGVAIWVWLGGHVPNGAVGTPPGPAPVSPAVAFPLEFPAARPLAAGLAGTTIALSPDGSNLVYLGEGDEGTQLLLRPMDRIEAAPIPGTRGAQQPFFSPDGQWVGFVAGTSLRKVYADGGPPVTLAAVPGNISGASWGDDGTVVFATLDGLWQLPAVEGHPRLVAAADSAQGELFRWPDMLPGSRHAVFTRVQSGNFELAVVRLSDGAVTRLNVAGTNPVHTDGHLLFARHASDGGQLFVAPFDVATQRLTGGPVRVADSVFIGPAGSAKLGVSRNGTLAYAPLAADDRTLHVVHRSGREDSIPAPARRYTDLIWSPDGGRLAVIAAAERSDLTELLVVDARLGNAHRVTNERSVLHPIWSPDGSRIAYAAKPDEAGWGYAVRLVSIDDATEPRTLLAPATRQFPLAFTPDRRALVYTRHSEQLDSDLWVLPLTGDSAPRRLIDGPSDESGAAVSPDGRWLAFVSNAGGRPQVYVSAFSAPDKRIRISEGGGANPQWGRDGRSLFYTAGNNLMMATVVDEPLLSVVHREVLFDVSPYAVAGSMPYAVHPDGDRFAMIRGPASAPQIMVRMHWLPR